jgi:CheY-like chemotaxis protein
MTIHRVLIVDDQREVRKVLRAGIESLGGNFKVIDVPSGEEAILIASQQSINLLVADIRLPGMSGLELFERIRRYNPSLKVILITGVPDPLLRRETARAGADAYFYKPIEMPDFLDTVERCLGVVETIFPPSPDAKSAPDKTGEAPLGTGGPSDSLSLTEQLTRLLREWGVLAALLLDDSGRVQARAGNLPAAVSEQTLLSKIIILFNEAAELSRLLGMEPPKDGLYFRGAHVDLYLAHADPKGHLVIFAPASSSDETRARVIGSLWPAARKWAEALALQEAAAPPPEDTSLPPDILTPIRDAPAQDAPAVEPDPEMDVILRQASQVQLDSQDIDAFWESANEVNSNTGLAGGSAISYDQARQMGLAPEDGE